MFCNECNQKLKQCTTVRIATPTVGVGGSHWDSGKSFRLKESCRAVLLKGWPSDQQHERHLTTMRNANSTESEALEVKPAKQCLDVKQTTGK